MAGRCCWRDEGDSFVVAIALRTLTPFTSSDPRRSRMSYTSKYAPGDSEYSRRCNRCRRYHIAKCVAIHQSGNLPLRPSNAMIQCLCFPRSTPLTGAVIAHMVSYTTKTTIIPDHLYAAAMPTPTSLTALVQEQCRLDDRLIEPCEPRSVILR